MSIFRELQRRSVFRIAILYLAAAWLLMQLADVLISLLSLSASSGRVVVLLLVLGFIPALVAAWVFELTPEGIKRESEIDRTKSAPRPTGSKVTALIVVLLVMAIGGFAFSRVTGFLTPGADVASTDSASATSTNSKSRLLDTPSIAVLPFTNLSADTEQGYFAAGMTEDVITNLTHVRGMRVISLNSTQRYEGTKLESQQIGDELGARHLLKGSVQKSGDRLQIRVQLIDSANADSYVWAKKWTRPVADFFALQDEITAKIINELEIKLVEGEQRRIVQQSTTNPDAYVAVRRGVVAFETLPKTLQSIATARQWFQTATELDPQYGIAFAWIAWCYIEEVVQNVSLDPGESLLQAEIWTQRARDLDESLSQVYDALGSISFMRGELEQAYKHQLKALELAPGYADVSVLIGDTLTALGRPEEALTHVKKGIDLNPYPPWWYWSGLGQAYMHLENYNEALEPTKRSLDMFPGFEYTRICLTIQFMALGREEEARDQAREIVRTNPDYKVGSSPYLQQMTDDELKNRFYTFLREAGLE